MKADRNRTMTFVLILILWFSIKTLSDYDMIYWHENSHERICQLYNGTVSAKALSLTEGNVTCIFNGNEQNVMYFYSLQETIFYHLKGFADMLWYFGVFIIVSLFFMKNR